LHMKAQATVADPVRRCKGNIGRDLGHAAFMLISMQRVKRWLPD
jgi:hypothetical protein